MKKQLTLAALALIGVGAMAQEAAKADTTGFVFTHTKEIPITSIKDQNRAGTCWCYSTLSFIEAELLRMGKGEYDFSEMYIVYNTYMDRADKAIRTHGDASFSQGGSFYDVLYGMKTFGLVPETEMRPGVMYGDTLSNHTELSAVTDAYVAAIAKGNHKKLQMSPEGTPLWRKGLEGIYDAYLGKRPEKFTYNGKEYTPQSFYETLGLNADDYVELTSFTHHPFYEKVMVEVPDNWDYALMYNVPLDEMMQVIDNAINTGYTVAWDGDLSEPGYAFKHHVAVNTKENIRNQKELKAKAKEEVVTQESRQKGFETFETVDDHLEHITGIVKDQDGVKYYKTKNSWGTEENGTGYHYISEEYVKGKTISILVHKNSIPKDIRKKLGMK